MSDLQRYIAEREARDPEFKAARERLRPEYEAESERIQAEIAARVAGAVGSVTDWFFTVDGDTYRVSDAVLIAGDLPDERERSGEEARLYRLPDGRYFLAAITNQDETRGLYPVDEDSARESYEMLPVHHVPAFPSDNFDDDTYRAAVSAAMNLPADQQRALITLMLARQAEKNPAA